ncbi:hypothetical protein ACFQ0G_10830 [Streptomyces chiangmaiensis]
MTATHRPLDHDHGLADLLRAFPAAVEARRCAITSRTSANSSRSSS